MKESNYQHRDRDSFEFQVVTPAREAAEALREVALTPPAIDIGHQSEAEITAAIGDWIDGWTAARRRAQTELDAIDPYPQPSHVWDPRSTQEAAQQQHDFALEAGYWWLV